VTSRFRQISEGLLRRARGRAGALAALSTDCGAERHHESRGVPARGCPHFQAGDERGEKGLGSPSRPARLESAHAGLEDIASPEAVALVIELAVDSYYRMDRAQMREWAGRALRAVGPLGDMPPTASTMRVDGLFSSF